MCHNIQISLATFAFTAVCCAFVFFTQKSATLKYLSIFTITFAMIQLSDALLWWLIRKKNMGLNRALSLFVVPVILVAELLVAYYGARHYLGWSNRMYEVAMWLYVTVFLGVWFTSCRVTTTTQDQYLKWCGFKFDLVMSLLFLAFLIGPIAMALPNTWLKYVVLVVLVGTFIVNLNHESFGTRWCWSSNVIAVVLVGAALANDQ